MKKAEEGKSSFDSPDESKTALAFDGDNLYSPSNVCFISAFNRAFRLRSAIGNQRLRFHAVAAGLSWCSAAGATASPSYTTTTDPTIGLDCRSAKSVQCRLISTLEFERISGAI